MVRKIYIDNVIIEYELEYKMVKNVNLRVKSDGTVHVSASKRVSVKFIEDFIRSRADFISNALSKFEKRASAPLIRYFDSEELRDFINSYCREVFPYYEARGVKYPEIKFKSTVSKWGSCHASRGIVTFSTYLQYAPPECVRYVVLHEFTHFFVQNHSRDFYAELIRVCPNYKELKEKMKYIDIRSVANG